MQTGFHFTNLSPILRVSGPERPARRSRGYSLSLLLRLLQCRFLQADPGGRTLQRNETLRLRFTLEDATASKSEFIFGRHYCWLSLPFCDTHAAHGDFLGAA